MTIEIHIDKSRNLTLFEVSGILSYHEIKIEVEAFYAGETTANVLWDFIETTQNLITPEQAEKILSMKQRYEGKQQSGKTAVVARDDFFYGLPRSLAMKSNLAQSQYTVMFFNSRETAYKWFEED